MGIDEQINLSYLTLLSVKVHMFNMVYGFYI